MRNSLPGLSTVHKPNFVQPEQFFHRIGKMFEKVIWLCESSGYEHCNVVICCIYTSYCDTICSTVENYVYDCDKTKTSMKSITPFCNAGSNAEVFDGVLEIVQGVCMCVSIVLCCCSCAGNSASLDRLITIISVYIWEL